MARKTGGGGWSSLPESCPRLHPEFHSGGRQSQTPMRECINSVRWESTAASKPKRKMKTKRKYPPSAERAGIYQAASPEIKVEENSQGITVAEYETNTASLAVSQLQGYPARESESQSGNPFHEFQQELSDMFEPKKIAHLFPLGDGGGRDRKG